jgi:nucleoside-diphosphate-sugar epimerase
LTSPDVGIPATRGRQDRIGIVGSSGFLGSHVLACGRAQLLDVAAVESPTIRVDEWASTSASADTWRRANAQEFERWGQALEGFDVVVNAAGMGVPTSADEQALYSANAVQPLLLGRACRLAGVRRLVHISSAAVQGRLDPLDETPRRYPFSPYTRSKAEGERCLSDAGDDVPAEVVLYRVTSVQGAERAITRRLVRLACAPVVPIAGKGDQPLPVALIDNVAHGIVFSAISPFPGPIVVQPSEDITTRQLFGFLSARRFLPVPARPVEWLLTAIRGPADRRPSLSTSVRGLELLLRGQRVAESSLTGVGFVLPVGHEGWKDLGDAVRAASSGGLAEHPGAISSASP